MLEFFFRSLLRGLSRKIGLRRAATGHVFSYNVLCQKIYPTLPEPRNICSLSFFNDFCPVGKLPNRRDHGSLSQNRPRIFRQQFMSFEKKTLLHTVRRALSLCAPNSIYHKVRTYKEYHSVCPSSELGLPPNPPPGG